MCFGGKESWGSKKTQNPPDDLLPGHGELSMGKRQPCLPTPWSPARQGHRARALTAFSQFPPSAYQGDLMLNHVTMSKYKEVLGPFEPQTQILQLIVYHRIARFMFTEMYTSEFILKHLKQLNT